MNSLYVSFGEPVNRDPSPGTIRTAAIETLDNDHALMELQQILPVSAANRRPRPGTRLTEAVETLGEDDAALELGLLTREKPKPEPGTTLTFTVETADEDGASVLNLLF